MIKDKSATVITVCRLTQAGGGLATKVHRVQTHRALGGSHVEPDGEAVGGVVVHQPLPLTVLQTAAVLWTESERKHVRAGSCTAAEPHSIMPERQVNMRGFPKELGRVEQNAEASQL